MGHREQQGTRNRGSRRWTAAWLAIGGLVVGACGAAAENGSTTDERGGAVEAARLQRALTAVVPDAVPGSGNEATTAQNPTETTQARRVAMERRADERFIVRVDPTKGRAAAEAALASRGLRIVRALHRDDLLLAEPRKDGAQAERAGTPPAVGATPSPGADRSQGSPTPAFDSSDQDDVILVLEPDGVATLDLTPNDAQFGSLWGMQSTFGRGIYAQAAWDIRTSANVAGTPIVVGVLDSGLDVAHPDLAPNVWVNPGEIPGNGLDDDGNG